MTDEQKKKLRQSVQLDLLEVSGIPEIYWDEIVLDVRREDVDAYKRLNEIKQNIYDISEPRLDMKNLLICSSKTGNGKTSWAIKLLQFFIFKSAQHYPEEENGFFVPTTEFVLASKEYDNSHRKKYWDMLTMIEKSRVVVFDDVGAGEYSRAEYMSLLSAIEGRVLRKQYCIFTSNFIEKDTAVVKRLGERLADRVFETSEKIILNGDGVRH
jgi:DNA replication protein DnaC